MQLLQIQVNGISNSNDILATTNEWHFQNSLKKYFWHNFQVLKVPSGHKYIGTLSLGQFKPKLPFWL